MHNVIQMSETTRSVFERFKKRQAPKLKDKLSKRDADIFWLRYERYFEDIYEPAMELYGDRPDFNIHSEAVFEKMIKAYIDRPEQLRILDLERQFTPDWFERANMVGYVLYVDLFNDTLKGLKEKINYLEELGVTYLHLMPLLAPRPELNDGGYAVMDYREVNPELGTMEDLEELSRDLHKRGISLCIDLVINHTAKEHEWAKRAMAGEEKYLEYFYTYRHRTQPDAYEKSLPEIFPDVAPGNFTWYEEMTDTGRWVWTTFNDYQWDLNYTNPAVFSEMLEIMFFLANKGVDILRLDAAPFIWKRMGTNCQNQPEVFKIIQIFRGLMKIVAPAVIFKAEAIVPPDQLQQYIGIKTTTGKQCELAYNNQLMVLLWNALATHKATLITHAFHKRRPPLLIDSSLVTYVRNHDDIGWAMADSDLQEIGMDPFMHRQFLNDYYTGKIEGSFARGELFQYNPETKDARMSGTTASLSGLEKALESGNEPEIELAVRRILLLHSIILCDGGIPLIYMGDEIGILNDYEYKNDPIKKSDSRWLHRPKMDWNKAEKRTKVHSIEARIYNSISHMIKVRKESSLLHSFALIHPLKTDNKHIWALRRDRPEQSILLIANFSDKSQSVDEKIIGKGKLHGKVYNLLAEGTDLNIVDGRLYLSAYETLWLVGDQ